VLHSELFRCLCFGMGAGRGFKQAAWWVPRTRDAATIEYGATKLAAVAKGRSTAAQGGSWGKNGHGWGGMPSPVQRQGMASVLVVLRRMILLPFCSPGMKQGVHSYRGELSAIECFAASKALLGMRKKAK
jgi:hypothetical protein